MVVVLRVGTADVSPLCHVGTECSMSAQNAPSWEFEDAAVYEHWQRWNGGQADNLSCCPGEWDILVPCSHSLIREGEAGRYMLVRALAYTRQARNQHYACGRRAPSLTDTARILACNLIERPPVSDRSIECNKCEAGATPQNEIARHIALCRGAF